MKPQIEFDLSPSLRSGVAKRYDVISFRSLHAFVRYTSSDQIYDNILYEYPQALLAEWEPVTQMVEYAVAHVVQRAVRSKSVGA